jgi:uncharacterized protein
MVGRMLDFQLLPFSFREFLSFHDRELHRLLERKVNPDTLFNFKVENGFGQQINKRLAEHLEKYIIYGGYPAVAVSSTHQEKQKILENITEKYILKDIKGLLNLSTEDEVIRLSKFLASQIGSTIKYGELSNSSNLTYKEVLKHLNILEKTFIVKLIKPYYVNKRTELTKNPKGYFMDTGMRNYLVSDFRAPRVRNDLGQLMENHAYNVLHHLNIVPQIKYWRTKSKAEVDFIIEKQQSVYPLEVKYVSRKIIGKSFYSFLDKFNPKTGIILTKDYLGEEKVRGARIKFIPLSYF